MIFYYCSIAVKISIERTKRAMLEIKNKEDIIIITLVIVLVVTLINCIINKEIMDIVYLFIVFYYFIRIMKIRLNNDEEEL